MENLNCTRCQGSGVIHYEGFTGDADKVFPPRDSQCHYCYGRGTFPAFSVDIIRTLILVTKGPNKGKLKKSFVSPLRKDGPHAARAYYVWRLARFHGGADTTMPMTASLLVEGDPCKADLDQMSDSVAKESFGTDLAAAFRWGKALGYLK